MLHLGKTRKMAYNPSVKNQKNGDGHPVINGDGKCCV